METIYKSDKKWAEHFNRIMTKESYGSERYEQARTIFAFLCNKIRFQQKVNQEEIYP